MRQQRIADVGWDVLLYSGCALAAGWLGAVTALPTHRFWSQPAMVAYAVAALAAFGLLVAARRGVAWAGGVPARSVLAGMTWLATVAVPMLWLTLLRAGGGAGGAQEEVRVVERAGQRWLDTGTPYLGRQEIGALAAGDQLEAYTPYQPAMAVFGIPRALDPAAGWWSDARIWFAAAMLLLLAAATLALPGVAAGVRLRVLQLAGVVPTTALASVVGGDDVPVLAACVLAMALATRGRWGLAGVAAGGAAALKLVAWPVAIALGVHAATRGRPAVARYARAALGIPLLTLVPSAVVNPAAVVENVLRFPLGLGLVDSPAEAPLPGHVIAGYLPGGAVVAAVLLVAAGLAFGARLWTHPPRTVADTARFSAVGLLVAMALMPATRFGYLMYPLTFLAWVVAFRPAPARKEPSGIWGGDRSRHRLARSLDG